MKNMDRLPSAIVVDGSKSTYIGQSRKSDTSLYLPPIVMSRIAFIAGTYLPTSCSVSDYTARLHTSLRDRGLESVVLTTHYAAEAAYDPYALGVVHGWHWADLKALVRAVWDSGADALHVQYHPRIYTHDPAVLLLPLLLRLSGWKSPIIVTIHEYGAWEWQAPALPVQFSAWLKQWGQQRQWWDREGGFLLTLSDAAIAIAPEAKTLIQSRLPNINHRLWHVPTAANVQQSAVNRSWARQKLRQICNWEEETLVIAYFGFIYPGKGLETLLPAFKQVLATQPQARLLLMGGINSLLLGQDANTYLTRLQTTINELELNQFIHFTGYLDAEIVSHYLAGADIGVLPHDRGVSLNSSSLMALLAHGLPAIATQLQSNLPATHPLLLIPPRDISALATALTELITCPEERQRRGEASRIFGESFNWQNITQQHWEIYQNLVTDNIR